jgi:hypothetical protein
VADTQQSYAHHTRWDPPFHFFILPVFVIATIAAIVHYVMHFRRYPIHGALVVLFALAALRVQDRVIRLEERLRLATVLPEPLRSRIPELTVGQLIALRFASDGELPGLVQKTLNEKLSRDDIKKNIQNWRADDWRV